MNPSEPLPPETESIPSPPPAPRRKINWLIFFAVLLAPLIASCIAGALDASNGQVAPVVTLLGGGASGIVCGVMLARRIGKSPGSRLALGIVFALLLIAVCVFMNGLGCLAGGYQVRFG